MARVAPEVGFGSSTGRGHDDRARVQVSRRIPHVCAKALSCLLLIAVTAGRITGNVVNVLNSASPELYGDMPIPVQVFDCFFRPLLGGLSFLPFLLRRSRCHKLSPKLYFGSLCGCLITMVTSFFLEWLAPHLLPRNGLFFSIYDQSLLVYPQPPCWSHIVKAPGPWLAPYGLCLLVWFCRVSVDSGLRHCDGD